MSPVDSEAPSAHPLSRRELLALAALVPLAGCGGGGSASPSPAPAPAPQPAGRTWRMGFLPLPARYDTAVLLDGIDRWSQRAEIGVIHDQLPWTELLSGASADAVVANDKLPLARYMRGKGLRLYFMADPTDGNARDQEAPELRALGRSIAEPVVQQAYRDYVAAMVRQLAPEYVGLAAETNLIRTLAPAAVYGGVVQAANAAAADLQGVTASPLFVSVQAETAWGGAGAGPYAGVAADLRDFPFTQWIGVTSYPFYRYARPEDLPDDYYARLATEAGRPLMVVEGGWPSAGGDGTNATPDAQARYLARQAQLLDNAQARGVVQLMFADLDLSTYPQPQPAGLVQFAHLGLVDSAFAAKPALAAWDGNFARAMSLHA